MADDNPFSTLGDSRDPSASVIIEPEIDRFPVWSLADVGKITGIAALALIFSTVLAVMVAAGLPSFRGLTANAFASDARLAVGSQLLAYLITFVFVYRLLVRHYEVPFLQAVRWNWPRSSWLSYALVGVALCLVVQALGQALQHVIPQPKHIPLQDLFRTRTAAWLLTFFGVLIGPPAEELFFRGLLFPSLKLRLGVWPSIGLTALAFTALHATQLAFGWGLLIGILIVGIVLTLIREKADSLAASMITHVVYNATVFGLVIRATEGFRHLERITG